MCICGCSYAYMSAYSSIHAQTFLRVCVDFCPPLLFLNFSLLFPLYIIIDKKKNIPHVLSFNFETPWVMSSRNLEEVSVRFKFLVVIWFYWFLPCLVYLYSIIVCILVKSLWYFYEELSIYFLVYWGMTCVEGSSLQWFQSVRSSNDIFLLIRIAYFLVLRKIPTSWGLHAILLSEFC